jgi:hypothetical protein
MEDIMIDDGPKDAGNVVVEPAPTEVPRRRGALAGNANRLRHGLRSRRPDRYGLALVGLGAAGRSIRVAVERFRRALETACLQRHGEIDVENATTISTAACAEQMRHLVTRAIAKANGELNVSLLRAVEQFLDKRDKAVARLGLGRDAVGLDGDDWPTCPSREEVAAGDEPDALDATPEPAGDVDRAGGCDGVPTQNNLAGGV